jgi:hypothetical protein
MIDHTGRNLYLILIHWHLYLMTVFSILYPPANASSAFVSTFIASLFIILLVSYDSVYDISDLSPQMEIIASDMEFLYP